MALKYSVVLATLYDAGGDVREKPHEVLETIAEMGYDGVDFDADPYTSQPNDLVEWRGIATSHGLKMPAILNASAGWHAGEERDLASPDEGARQRALVHFKKCIDLAAQFDEHPLFQFSAVAFRPEYPVSSIPAGVLREQFLKSSIEVATYAAERDVKAAIEPLNRFEGYAGFMNTVPEVKALVDELGMDNLGILADFFHMNIEDNSLAPMLRLAGDKLMHIHLADSNRYAPGTGHVDFLDVVRTLKAMDYQRYLSVDCLPARPDWKTLLASTLSFMKRMEEATEFEETVRPPR